MAEENVSATLTIAAPATVVFAILADPATHSAIDGTGWVRQPVDRTVLTEVGQLFRMDMYYGEGYRVVNKVQVLEPPRAIGWFTGQEKDDGELEFGGWTWRYDLTPLGPAGTEVTLSYDWSAVPQFIRDRGINFPPFPPDHLVNSLHHLAELAEASRLAAGPR
ncbi:SRPBCC family protein [Amycolatopsis sp. NPDC051903]|uniref:SRPBCC family protein n=1 Tax=Amycolatopsis sp. NPDC051903 TaxID=3363936 RepID=UPI0037B5902F